MGIRANSLASAWFLLSAACAGATAQRPEEQAVARYRGAYLADCGDSTSARAFVSADSLVLTCGDRRLVGRDPRPAYSWFGEAAPEGFALALLATGPEGRDLTWLVYDEPGGRRLTIDDGPDAGMDVTGLTFSHCDTALTVVAAPAPPSRTYSLDELSAPGLLFDERGRAAYLGVLGPLRDEPWLVDLDGPSPQNRRVTVGGREYLLLCACKNHDCWDNNVVLLYAAADGVVYGLVNQSGRSTLLGMPTTAVAHELERLWREEFRQGQP